MSWACLYDRQFKPLGAWTQHVVSEWSLTRKAYEFDEFKLTCKGFENSRNACYIALFSNTGKIQYLSFCGIPVTKDELTTVSGIDCRQLFNQTIMLDLGARNANGEFKINSVKSLFKYLLNDREKTEEDGLDLGIDYEVDTSDLTVFSANDWKEEAISREKKVQELWKVIQTACNLYNVVVIAEAQVDAIENQYKLVFKVMRITEKKNIKLSDYDVRMSNTQNVVNRAIATNGSDSKTYYLTNRYEVKEYSTNSKDRLYPPRIATIYKDPTDYEDEAQEQGKTQEQVAFNEAKAEAIQKLNENRYKDKVTINLNTKLGSTLEDVDFRYMGVINQYLPADYENGAENTVKELPVMSIKEDSKGNKCLTFGRLSDFWFMDD
jgi:hypothetical protein